MVEDQLYHMEQGEFMIFPPYVMHHSYGEKNVPFKRLVLYFTPEEVAVAFHTDRTEGGDRSLSGGYSENARRSTV